MFKVGGLWVSPVEVERVLASHPAVLECAVVEGRGPNEMVKPSAYICLSEGYDGTTDLLRDLLRHCGDRLPAYKCPRWVNFVDELPRTATGKVQRLRLRPKSR